MYNRETNCYDVTFIGQNVGTVVAEAKLGNYIARLTIEVTASLKLEASSTNISVYSGDTDTITLTVKDANDKQLLAETEKTLRWEIAVDNNGVQQEVIECSKDDIKLNADGTFSLPLTGFAAGEATVSITCTYPYGAATAAEPAKEVTATLYISATTKPSDVLGLTNGASITRFLCRTRRKNPRPPTPVRPLNTRKTAPPCREVRCSSTQRMSIPI